MWHPSNVTLDIRESIVQLAIRAKTLTKTLSPNKQNKKSTLWRLFPARIFVNKHQYNNE